MSSLSASAENVSSGGSGAGGGDSNSQDGSSSMCLELALEGERLCKAGDCRAGVAFLQAAIQAGTEDLRTLSAIYSQLGNAYFYLADYPKAMQYHKLDLTLARSMNDKLGEAKSSGNLGNTLKVMGRFDEAVICCDRHLTLARQLGDKLSEGRALYNLGNVYHAKGKHMGQRNPGDFGDDVKEALSKAVEYYKQNLKLMRELGDRSAQGRACGNLGNTYYLLGDFQAAIEHHQNRLRIAREYGDKAAERRANSNLGNSHIFLGQFEDAAEHYKRTLALAVELGEREVEAQACYSLGNTYTLLREFGVAIEYHRRHLAIARELCDRVGEARACWSLGNAYSAIGKHYEALQYAESHLRLARELQDKVGESTATVNICDLRKILGFPELKLPIELEERYEDTEFLGELDSNISQGRMVRVRRQSMEQLDLIKITPDGKQQQKQQNSKTESKNNSKAQDDDFFELLSRSQSKRMDDQRCAIKIGNGQIPFLSPTFATGETRAPEELQKVMEMDKERVVAAEAAAAYPPDIKTIDLNASNNSNSQGNAGAGATHAVLARSHTTTEQPDDAFLDMLMRCQSSRLEEQRSELPKPNLVFDAETPRQISNFGRAGNTVPDDDFFSLIMKVQSGRMEDQRAAIPIPRRDGTNANNNNNVK
uniref:G-protein-signaling modulator 2 n=1 Tax=Glossina morsitans morsitans TaxID=37546 RepID=A0A1B0FKV2_GLOMM